MPERTGEIMILERPMVLYLSGWETNINRLSIFIHTCTDALIFCKNNVLPLNLSAFTTFHEEILQQQKRETPNIIVCILLHPEMKYPAWLFLLIWKGIRGDVSWYQHTYIHIQLHMYLKSRNIHSDTKAQSPKGKKKKKAKNKGQKTKAKNQDK